MGSSSRAPGTNGARSRRPRELALGRAIERQQAEIERLEKFVTRFRAGTRARQAQSRQKRLDRIDRLERDPRDGRDLTFAFKPPERSGRVVFELQDGGISIGDRVLLDHAQLWLERGEHVSVVGPNGAGKTTLIEALVGVRQFADDGSNARDAAGMAVRGGQRATPDIDAAVVGRSGPLVTGKLRTGHNVKVGFLSQHADEIGGGTARTVLEACQRATGLTPAAGRALLGRFLFSGEEAEKPLDGLSGGERRRLSLAILVQSGANVLILDEPTNHLDIESREALEDALSQFTGSLLLISHDRALLDAVGTRTVAFEDETLHSYVGGWPEYLRIRQEREAAGGRDQFQHQTPAKSAGKPVRNKPAGPSKNARARQASLEQEIQQAEAALQTLEVELADPGAWATPEKSAASTERHEHAKRAVDALYARYEEIAG